MPQSSHRRRRSREIQSVMVNMTFFRPSATRFHYWLVVWLLLPLWVWAQPVPYLNQINHFRQLITKTNIATRARLFIYLVFISAKIPGWSTSFHLSQLGHTLLLSSLFVLLSLSAERLQHIPRSWPSSFPPYSALGQVYVLPSPQFPPSTAVAWLYY